MRSVGEKPVKKSKGKGGTRGKKLKAFLSEVDGTKRKVEKPGISNKRRCLISKGGIHFDDLSCSQHGGGGRCLFCLVVVFRLGPETIYEGTIKGRRFATGKKEGRGKPSSPYSRSICQSIPLPHLRGYLKGDNGGGARSRGGRRKGRETNRRQFDHYQSKQKGR